MAVFVSESFTGADTSDITTHTGETGATWAIHPNSTSSASVSIFSNRMGTANSDAIVYASGTPATAEYDVAADLVVVTVVGFNHGICGRMSTSANTFYMARYTSGSNIELYKRVAGTFTVLSSAASGTITAGQTYALKLEIRDAAKKVFLGGVEIVSSTDNAITAAGKVGIRSAGGNTNSSTGGFLDNLTATDAAANGGQAALTGAGTLAGTATKTMHQPASPAGTGSLSAVPRMAMRATAALSGLGAITASPAGSSAHGQAALTGLGSTIAVPRMAQRSPAVESGVGSLSAVPRMAMRGQAALTGNGAAQAVGTGGTAILGRQRPIIGVGQ
jgi:hypothetical protein